MEPTPEMQELARQAMLRQELAAVNDLVPKLTPLPAERMPKTLQEFQDLPESWRSEVPADTVQVLMDKAAVGKQLAAADKQKQRVATILEGTGISSREDFDALEPGQRKAITGQLTDEQKSALIGELPPAPEEGYL